MFFFLHIQTKQKWKQNPPSHFNVNKDSSRHQLFLIQVYFHIITLTLYKSRTILHQQFLQPHYLPWLARKACQQSISIASFLIQVYFHLYKSFISKFIEHQQAKTKCSRDNKISHKIYKMMKGAKYNMYTRLHAYAYIKNYRIKAIIIAKNQV